MDSRWVLVVVGILAASFLSIGFVSAAETYNTHGVTLGSAGSAATAGMSVVATADVDVVSVTRASGQAGVYAYVLNAANVSLGNATFVGDVATFSTPISLTAGSTYRVVVGTLNSDPNVALRYAAASFPYSGGSTPHLNWTISVAQNVDNSWFTSSGFLYAVAAVNTTAAVANDTITFTNHSRSSDFPGTEVTFSITMTSVVSNITGYIFSFDNGTGAYVNDSNVTFSQNPRVAEVTKFVNATSGSSIRYYWTAYNSNFSVVSSEYSYQAGAAPGVFNFTNFAGNPVGKKSVAGECTGWEMGDTTVIYNSDSGTLDFWYFTCNAPTQIWYGNTSDPYNLTVSTKSPTNIPNATARPSIVRVGDVYHLFVAGLADQDIYHYNSTDRISWTDVCGGPAVVGSFANSGHWYDSDTGVWDMMVENVGGSVSHYNSSDGCSWSFQSNLGQGYGPWLWKFNDTWITYVVRSSGAGGAIYSVYNGTSLDSMSFMNNFTISPQAYWGGGVSVGDPSPVWIPSSDVGVGNFDRGFYFYYGVESATAYNAVAAVATDLYNRSFWEVHGVSEPMTPPTPPAPINYFLEPGPGSNSNQPNSFTLGHRYNITCTECAAGDNFLLYSVNRTVGTTNNIAYLFAEGGTTQLANASFSGNEAVFNYTFGNVSSVNNTRFVVAIGQLSGSGTIYYNNGYSTWPRVMNQTRSDARCYSSAGNQASCQNFDTPARWEGILALTVGIQSIPVVTDNVDFSNHSRSSDLPGVQTQFSITMTGEISDISHYIFSFDNGTGVFVNDSNVSVGALAHVASVSKFVNSTVGSTIRYSWTAFNGNGSFFSGVYSYLAEYPASETLVHFPRKGASEDWKECVGGVCSGPSSSISYPDTSFGEIKMNGPFNVENINVTGQDWRNKTINISFVFEDLGQFYSTGQGVGVGFGNGTNGVHFYNGNGAGIDFSINSCNGGNDFYMFNWVTNCGLIQSVRSVGNHTFNMVWTVSSTNTTSNAKVYIDGVHNAVNGTVDVPYPNNPVGSLFVFGNDDESIKVFNLTVCEGVCQPYVYFGQTYRTSEVAGVSTTLRVNVSASSGSLGNYTFSVDDGAGTFVNQTPVVVGASSVVAEHTYVVNSTAGSTIRYRVYSDIGGVVEESQVFSFVSIAQGYVEMGYTSTLSQSNSFTLGQRINLTCTDCLPWESVVIGSVKRFSGVTNDVAMLLSGNGSVVLDNASFSGDLALLEYDLGEVASINNTYFVVAIGQLAGSGTTYYQSSVLYPKVMNQTRSDARCFGSGANVLDCTTFDTTRWESIEYFTLDFVNNYPSVGISGVVVNDSVTGGSPPFWDGSTSFVNVSWVSNVSDVLFSVYVGTTKVLVVNGTSALVGVGNFSVGQNYVNVSFMWNDTYSFSSAKSDNFVVSFLSSASNVQPSGLDIKSPYNATWSAATDGVGTVTYDVYENVAGTNVSIASATTNTYAVLTDFNETNEGQVWVIASDDYFTADPVRNAADFIILYAANLSNEVCTLTYPNELDMPSQASIPVSFDLVSEAGFDGSENVSANLTLGSYHIVGDCSYVANSGTNHSYTCSMAMPFYYLAGFYDLNIFATATAGKTASFSQSGYCEYGELVASQRDVNVIAFSGASPGVENVSSGNPLVLRNTGNVPFNVSMKAYNLTGRSQAQYQLGASAFRVGESLGASKVMAHNVTTALNVSVANGLLTNSTLWFWLSMPVGQVSQQYYSQNYWQAVVSG